MQKKVAYLLLIAFAIYHLGFYIFYFSIDMKIDHQWEAKTFRYHQMNKPMKMSYALSLPYVSPEMRTLKSNYSFKKDGVYYRVLEQSYKNGTVEITYVFDEHKNKLEEIIQTWGASHGFQGEAKSQSKLSTSFLKDFLITHSYELFREADLSVQKCEFIYASSNKSRLLEAPPIPPPIYS